MARKKNGTTKALSITLTLSNYATLEELRWERRKSFSDMLDEAVGTFIDQNSISRVLVEDEATLEAEAPAVETDEKPGKPVK